jgi:hypothetical protein
LLIADCNSSHIELLLDNNTYLLGNTSTTEYANIDECTAFHKTTENLVEITASKGSIAAVHIYVVPDTPVVPY